MTTASEALAPMLRKLRLWAHLNQADEQALLGLPHTVTKIKRHQKIVT